MDLMLFCKFSYLRADCIGIHSGNDVLEVIIDTDVRFHLKDANKQQDIKPWRFIRVNLK